MSIAKPFIFVANTYAKASEVNANFDTVYSQVNSNISAISQNAVDIENLENNKADINGSSSQRFGVADAVTGSDAINKQSLMKSIGNSLDYISGFIITKDSGSPNDTIIISDGSCYDSTHTAVLSLTNSLSKQNTNQASNATYYVYIIGNSTGSSVDILISESSTTPALPSLYRQIGYYTTDSSSNIDKISYYGTDPISDKSPIGSINAFMPDWSRKINISNDYTVQNYGWINWGVDSSGLYNDSLTVNEINIGRAFNTYGDRRGGGNAFVPVSPGDTVAWTRSTWAHFIPCKGA